MYARVSTEHEAQINYVKGDFEPLVSEEMWERCQQILDIEISTSNR